MRMSKISSGGAGAGGSNVRSGVGFPKRYAVEALGTCGIVVCVAARDARVKAVACVNGFGDGERTVRAGVPYDAWLRRNVAAVRDRRGFFGTPLNIVG